MFAPAVFSELAAFVFNAVPFGVLRGRIVAASRPGAINIPRRKHHLGTASIRAGMPPLSARIQKSAGM